MSAPTAPSSGRRLVELFVLSGLALGQPLLDVFGRSAETFVYRQVGLVGILAFTASVLTLPPLVLWVPSLLVRRWALAQKVVHDAAMGALWIFLAVQLVKRLPDIPNIFGLLLGVVAAATAITLGAAGKLRTWFTYLSPAPLVFAAVFLLMTPVSTQVLVSKEVPAKDVTVTRPSPVVVIVFDEFPLSSLVGRDGRVDADLFPGFAALERNSTFFGNTTSSAHATVAALPSLLSGKAPTPGALPVASAHADSLFTLLGRSHEMRAHELLSLCPRTICDRVDERPFMSAGLPALATDVNETLLELIDPRRDAGRSAGAMFGEAVNEMKEISSDDSRRDVSGLRVAGRFEAFLDDVARPATDKPALNFLHILLPHAPWTLLPDGRQYAEPDSLLGLSDEDVWSEDPVAADLARQRHLLQVQHVDRLVMRLVETMRAADVWDETTLVLTGDHGVSTTAGEPRRGVTADNLHELAWVPLFLKTPHQTGGGLDTRPARSVDILPTIADAQGVEVPWRLDGTSLLAAARSPSRARPITEREFLGPKDRAFPVDERSRRRALAESAGAFAPEAGDPYRLFRRSQANGDLVGERLVGQEILTRAAGAVELTVPRRPVVERGSAWSPALVAGRITGARVSEVAVTVNGIIAAVSAPLADGQFAAMTVPDLYRPGVNDVRLFAVRMLGERRVLAPLEPA